MADGSLPTGIPKLDALVRAEAERLSIELWTTITDSESPFDIDPDAFVVSFDTLLRNLSRRESRDWAACALAGLVGVTVGATTPNWYWTDRRSDSTDRDGAPNGDGWPSGWWLMNNIGEACFFSGEPAEEWDPEMGHIVWIPGLPSRDESAAPALALALASVMGHTLLLARAGVRFQLSAEPVWVRRLAYSMAVAHDGEDRL